MILFRADASALIGGGHVRRCLALADALRVHGWRSMFVGTLDHASQALVARAGHRWTQIATPSVGDGRGWETLSWPTAAQESDADAFSAATPRDAEWIVVDHYKLDAVWDRRARAGRRLLVFDDLANRCHDADILLDSSLGRQAENYRGLVPTGAAVLAGPQWALLRPEFAAERTAALVRRCATVRPRAVLVSLGTTDIGGYTSVATQAAAMLEGVERIDVVVASTAASYPVLVVVAARDPRVRLHIDSDQMAVLMRDADLAIGAAGSTSWERCCLGLPSVMLVLADNQRMVARALAESGAALVLDAVGELPAALSRASDATTYAAMVAAAAAVCDGLGVPRTVDLMLSRQSSNGGVGGDISRACC